jgi:hypothetical protein
MNRRVFLCSLVIAAGCARSDWIESTLVTVDATGRWVGSWDRPYGGGGFIMTLQQTGPKVIGDISLTGWNAGPFSGPIEGTVSGDVLKFSRPDLRGEGIVAGDALTGTITFGNVGTVPLRLQRQSGGQPDSR